MTPSPYEDSFYDRHTAGSLASARIVLPILFEYYRPDSAVDVGCGRGAWLKVASENGTRRVLGLDGDYVRTDSLLIDQGNFKACDLTQRITASEPFDLAISLEVAEHLPFHRSETFVADLVGLSKVVLFSAAMPYQGGTKHINEQWLEFWAILFRRHNYLSCDVIRPRIWANEDVEFWYSQNVMVFASERVARERFPQETIATAKPLSLPHPKTFLVNVTRYRPLSGQASEYEMDDYRSILHAYLAGETTLPLMRTIDAKGGSNGVVENLFPGSRTEIANVQAELAARDDVLQRLSLLVESQDKRIPELSQLLEQRERQLQLKDDEVVNLTREIQLLQEMISNLEQQLVRKDGQIDDLRSALARTDVQLAAIGQERADGLKEIALLRDSLARRDGDVSRLTETVRARAEEIARLIQLANGRAEEVTRVLQLADGRAEEVARLIRLADERAEEVAGLIQLANGRAEEVGRQERTINELGSRLDRVLESRSWKLTGPFRNARSRIEGAFSARRSFRRLLDGWIIRRSGLFDPEWYLESNPDVAQSRYAALEHFLIFGAKEGRSPHPLFDTAFYVANNRDVVEAGLNPLSHFVRHGGREGRNPSPHFDCSWYFAAYPDVAQRSANPLVDYIKHGAAAGRDPGPHFSTSAYLRRYPDVARAAVNPLQHYVRYGRAEGRFPGPDHTRAEKHSAIKAAPVAVESAEKTARSFSSEIEILGRRLETETAHLDATVSVVIPCYNYGEYVREAVASVLNQTYRHVRAVVVNDGSSDAATLEILSVMGGDRVTVLHQENQGLSSARNNGAALTDSDYLMFLDADDRLAPEAVALLLLELESNPDTAYAFPYQRFFGDQELVWAPQEYNAYDILWRNHPSVCSLIHRDWFRKAGGYSPQMLFGWEDWEHWVNLSIAGARGLCVPVPVFHHRRHGVTMTHTAQSRQSYLARTLWRLNETAYSVSSLVERKIQWRPTVSVVVPFYNRTEYLAETLASLSNQTLEDFEIIIVNDGSERPEALQLLQTLAGGRTRIVHREHGGLSAARNTGVAAARSEFVYFLDSDDYLDPNALESLVLMALTHPSTAFFYSGVVHFGAVEGVCLDHFDSNRLLKENFLAAACLIRRDVYMEVGGQDESLINNYEDYDFWLRLLTAGHRGMLFPEPLFHYRRHADSLRNQHLASGDTHDALLTRLRKRHPALYGGPAADRSTWKLMPAVDRARHEPVTEDFANLYRSGSGLAYESWRLPNAPAPFQPRFWNDERYHILYCIPYCCIGGAERVDLDILAALPKDVFHVTLVTIESDENKWLPRFRELVSEIVMIPNFSINATQTAAVLQYLCFSRNIDLIFNRNTHPGYVLAEGIRKITRTVTTADLLHLHDSGRDWARASAVFHDQLDARIVISKDLQNHMNSAYALPADDFTVIRNGVDTRRVLTDEQAELAARSTRSEFGIPFDAPVVGFVGRFAHQKDPLRWLAVAKTVSALLPDVHFLMVGDGDLRQDVERCVSAYGLESRVHLTGFRDDVDRIYPALSVLLMTSLYEGLPLIILEAMLHGVPVVSTATGATSECVGENVGALVAVDASPDVIAGKVIELLGRAKSDPELRNRCKRNIHDHFSLSQMQSAYRREFESLCRNRDVNQRLEDYSEWLMTNSLSW